MEILQNILRTKIGHTHTFDGFIDHKVCNIISWTIWEYVPNQTWGENTYNECKSNYRENQSFSVESSKGQNW